LTLPALKADNSIYVKRHCRCFLWFVAVLALAVFNPCLLSQTTEPASRTRVVNIDAPTEIWPGWQKGLIDTDPVQVAHPPDQYTSFPTPPRRTPTFSGKVVGLDSYDNAEVAIVGVFGAEYLYDVAYHWAMVREDGTFSLTAPSRFLDSPRTLCVRAPGRPWTFLRHDFSPGESGKDIVLKCEPGKSVLVRAQLEGGPAKAWMSVEAFDGYQRRDRDGNPAQSQYHGGQKSDDGSASIMLPLRPMALRVRAEGSAAGCVIVDPRETDELIVHLPREARLKGSVVQGNRSLGMVKVIIFNPCGRLSMAAVQTGTDGSFEFPGLMAGTYMLEIEGQRFEATLQRGKTNSARYDLANP
jgi:hypothetical protein